MSIHHRIDTFFRRTSAFTTSVTKEEITCITIMEDNMSSTVITFHDISAISADGRRRESSSCRKKKHVIVILNIIFYDFFNTGPNI